MAMYLKRTEGVTVITVTSDPSSTCPPVCQLLGSLCYTPALCSWSRHVAIPRRGSQAVLGSLWIMSGLMHVALGSILLFNRGAASYMLTDTYCPLWLGVVFAVIGVSSILTEKYPRPCVLLLSAILNLAGAAMSIVAIIWYSMQFNKYRFRYYFPCKDHDDDDYWNPEPTATPGSQQEVLLHQCQDVREVLQGLVFGVSGVLLAVSVLGLCLGLSSVILSIKGLRSPRDTSESADQSKPLLEDDGTAASQYDQE